MHDAPFKASRLSSSYGFQNSDGRRRPAGRGGRGYRGSCVALAVGAGDGRTGERRLARRSARAGGTAMVRTSSERQALGERLKRQRERRGITLESISQATKVAASLYAGLERGDCSRWPAGLYGRAYARAYAEAIGMNADEVVEDFTSAYGGGLQPDGSEGPVTPAPRVAALRLAMVDEPSATLERTARRASLTAADLVIGSCSPRSPTSAWASASGERSPSRSPTTPPAAWSATSRCFTGCTCGCAGPRPRRRRPSRPRWPSATPPAPRRSSFCRPPAFARVGRRTTGLPAGAPHRAH